MCHIGIAERYTIEEQEIYRKALASEVEYYSSVFIFNQFFLM